jgi:hypothetical protein
MPRSARTDPRVGDLCVCVYRHSPPHGICVFHVVLRTPTHVWLICGHPPREEHTLEEWATPEGITSTWISTEGAIEVVRTAPPSAADGDSRG